MDSEVAICRTDWSRTGEKETEEEKCAGDLREAALLKLKADLIIDIPRDSLGPPGKDYQARGDW